METTMELDDLKQAWQSLDRRLEQNNTLQLQLYRDGKLGTLRRRLRPLAWGQAIQMIVGVLIVLMSAAFWSGHQRETHLLVAGVIVHGYGLAMILCGAFMQGWLSRIDYAAPVLTIQKQLASVRRLYVISGMWLGLAWWFIWMPMVMVFFKVAFGADLYLYTNAPTVIWIGSAIGVVGLLVTWWLHHWSRQSNRPRLAKLMEDSVTGSSLRKAQGILDEITQFEQM